MASFNKRIVISGYYGFQNSGDEAVLKSILLALQETAAKHSVKIEPIVLSANPDQTARTYGVKSESRTNLKKIIQTIRQADGLISGGGSLLQDVTGVTTIPYYLSIIKIAQWLNKPTFIYGQGIGPVNRKIFHFPIKHVFGKAKYVSVRDVQSKQWLESLGLQNPVHLVPDPVMGMPPGELPVESTNTDQQWIGVSVRFWKNNTVYLDRLAELLNHLLQNERTRIIFLPFHQLTDDQASLYVIDKIHEGYKQRIQLKPCADPQQMLAAVGQCQLLIGMRLHALIYAANQRVPMVGISYDPKIDQFLSRLQMMPMASTEHFDVQSSISQIEHLLQHGDQWRESKRESIENLKNEAVKPAQSIIHYFVNKG